MNIQDIILEQQRRIESLELLIAANLKKTALIGAGNIVQVVYASSGAYNSGITTIPQDNTIPQKTEGNEFMTLAITPKSATNKLLIEVIANTGGSLVTNLTMALFQDATTNALAATWGIVPLVTSNTIMALRHYMTAGTILATTFKIRIGGGSGTFYFNGIGAGYFGGVLVSSITITEIIA